MYKLLAKLLSRPVITDWLVRKAKQTPYFDIIDPKTGEVYMERYWLVKPSKFMPFSARIHIIRQPDSDRHLHDHPWTFRSFVLDGSYTEERIGEYHYLLRCAGDTYKLDAKSYHRINEIFANRYEGVVSLFVCGKYQHRWGFLTPIGKVPYDEYLGIPRQGSDVGNAS